MEAQKMDKQTLAIRSAEIVAELAELKRAFFVDSVEKPISVRVTLEAELANIRLQKAKSKSDELRMDMQIRRLRGAILKDKLKEMGYPTLVEQCNTEAIAKWKAMSEEEKAKIGQ